MRRRTLGWILLAAVASAPRLANAAAPGGSEATTPGTAGATLPGGGQAPLLVERQRLRTELDRANAEIDALKGAGRGLRDDYRLRHRLADAEALARRLTDIDAHLKASGLAREQPTNSAAMSWPAAPEAKPSDDRAVLEAKADILADQARRLSGQADLLAGRVTDLRARQELRRRAGQLERDPFSQLEQAKRRLAATGSGSGSGSNGAFAPAAANGAKDSVVSVMPPAQPTRGEATGFTPGGSSGPVSTATPTSAPAGPTSVTAGFVEKAQPTAVPSAVAGDSAAPGSVSVSAQFRGILDATTLAEIRRLEGSGSAVGPGSLQAMEKALAAVRARATQLNAAASALRARAQTPPR